MARGLVTASIPPSLITRYGAELDLGHALVLAISQSGESPDIVATLRAATAAGAFRSPAVEAMLASLDEVADQFAGDRRALALAS